MAAATASGLQLARGTLCFSQSTSTPITVRSRVCNLTPNISFASSAKTHLQSSSFLHSTLQLSRIIKTEAALKVRRGSKETLVVANDNGEPSGLLSDWKVGIDESVKQVLGLLEIESKRNDVTVILHGFGGMGKTTLADAVFSQVGGFRGMGKTTLADAVFSQVGGCRYSHVQVFVDIDSKPNIVKLQKDILKDLMGPEEPVPDIRKYQDGQRELERVLREVQCFVYIDSVLDKMALIKLLPRDITTAKKVRFLLTASDKNVKNVCRSLTKPKIYSMKGIEHGDAMLILKREIEEGINDTQFSEIIQICRKIPLMLTLAAEFIGRADNKQEAFSTLMRQKDKWTSEYFKEMRYAFAFAYDSLPQDCKDPFLDICSYFKGWDWDTVEDIVGKVELEMLENRALVTRDRNGVASVNDVISTLACQMSKKVRLTFTSASELKKFLEEKDTQGIKGIWLTQNDDNYDVLHISASRLDSMSNSLRVLHLGSSTKVEGNCFYIFDELVFLKGKIVPLPFHFSQLEQLRYLSYEPPP